MRRITALVGVILVLFFSYISLRPEVVSIQKYILPLNVDPWGNQSSKESHVAFVKIGYTLAEEFGLNFISFSGYNVFVRSTMRDPTYGLNFVSDKLLNVEDARALASSVFTRYLQFAERDSLVLQRLKNHNEFYKSDVDLTSTLAFCITFWDQDLEYQVSPFVARIQYFKSTLSIFSANPETGRLELIWSGKLDRADKA